MASNQKEKSKLSGPEQVKAFLDQLEHPCKNAILEVRKIILGSQKQLEEHIKWNAPSFLLAGEDRITFNFYGLDFFRLVFHVGVKVKSNSNPEPLFTESTGLLNWVAADRAVVRFTDLPDVREKEPALAEVITKWFAYTG